MEIKERLDKIERKLDIILQTWFLLPDFSGKDVDELAKYIISDLGLKKCQFESKGVMKDE